MMGRLNHDPKQFFYSFRLDEAVPNDHPVREVAAVLDLSWVQFPRGDVIGRNPSEKKLEKPVRILRGFALSARRPAY